MNILIVIIELTVKEFLTVSYVAVMTIKILHIAKPHSKMYLSLSHKYH